MLITLIRYSVDGENREAFDGEQRLWRRLHHTDGFVWRGGGWTSEDKASILGLWRDRDARRAFEGRSRNTLSRLLKGRAHTRVVVLPWQSSKEIPGQASHFKLALARARYLVVELYKVRADRVEHFDRMQKELFVPAMSAAKGMLGGLFAAGEGNWQMTLTAWNDGASHEVFNSTRQKQLVRDSAADQDCLEGRRYAIKLVPEWTIRG